MAIRLKRDGRYYTYASPHGGEYFTYQYKPERAPPMWLLYFTAVPEENELAVDEEMGGADKLADIRHLIEIFERQRPRRMEHDEAS
jgi:hypothetical protein